MVNEKKIDPSFAPGPRPRTVVDTAGVVREVPKDWELLPPGDAGLTRRVKAAGEFWGVQEKRGRKVFSKGVYAPATTIQAILQQLEAERSTETYAKRRQSDARRRDQQQSAYQEDFHQAIVDFLDFDPRYHEQARLLAILVTAHATPVGSGTVARTKRLPIEQRASAAVIAWMRHQTTAYDSMSIPRVKGKRREVRQMLAARSREILEKYRTGKPMILTCPLANALGAEP